MQSIGVGFSFNGIHCDDMECELMNNDECMHAISDVFTMDTETVNGYDGEYYAGETVRGRDFNIEIFIEDAGDDVLMNIGNWLGRGKSGRLVFDHRPYKYYIVRIAGDLKKQLYTGYNSQKNMFTYSGTITVPMKALRPRAYMLEEVRSKYPNVGNMIATLDNGSGIVSENMRPVNQGTTSVNILNAGNAEAYPEIWISGKFPSGTSITNTTTGQSMTICDDGKATRLYCIDSMLGRTTLWSGAVHPRDEETHASNLKNGTYEYADNVKDGKFITLKSCFPRWRDMDYEVLSKNSIKLGTKITGHEKNTYIYINGWYKITGVNGDTISIDGSVTTGRRGKAMIAVLNNITVTPGAKDVVELMTVYHKDTFY